MKTVGFLLITVAFLGGSLVAVVDKDDVNWVYFSAAIIAGVAGIVIVHLCKHRSSRSEEKIEANLQDINTSLSNIVENITQLNGEKESIDTYDLRHRIDELFEDDRLKFVQARESLAHAYSLNVYADVMSHFAAAERYLNRVWSASADGYVNEAAAYLDKAQSQFTNALDEVRKLSASTA